jgi:ribosomal protein S18 acetylase RimI-like enzyme
VARSGDSPAHETTPSTVSHSPRDASSKPAGRPDVLVRRARLEDEPHIRAFTQNTFEWGDYVADAFSEWLQSGSDVYVAEVDGIPVGVTCVAYPAEGEAWFQGIRVKADLRRMGIASMLTETSIAGARERGARVSRANIDSDNYRSQGLAKTMGFRQVSRISEFTVPLAGCLLSEADVLSKDQLTSADASLAGVESDAGIESGAGIESRAGIKSRDGLAPTDGNMHLAIQVTRATPEEAGQLFDAASKQIRYLGCEYVWISLTRQNLARAATEEWLLVARDGRGKTLAGGLMSNPYVEDHIHTGPEDEDGRDAHTDAEGGDLHVQADAAEGHLHAHADAEKGYLCAGLGSLFGTREGVVAIIRHALGLLGTQAAKRNITPGELFVSVESESPVAEELLSNSRQAGLDMREHGETGLWELRLTG